MDRTNGHNQYGQPIGWRVDPVLLDRPPSTPMEGRYCLVVPLESAKHGSELYEEFCLDLDGTDWTYLSYGPFGSEAEFIDWVRAVEHLDDPFFLAIVDRTSGRTMGVASYLRIDPASASIEVGHIHFGQSLQRTPAATEAMYLMMRWVFESGYRRYEWKCDALNAPSMKAAERLGFTHEGIFRQATIYKGRNRDTAWFSVIDSDWPSLAAGFERWLAPGNFDDTGLQRSPLHN